MRCGNVYGSQSSFEASSKKAQYADQTDGHASMKLKHANRELGGAVERCCNARTPTVPPQESPMNHRPLILERNHFARLHGAICVQVSRGTLWLTIDGEPDDRVLQRGDRIELPRGAHALAQALDAPVRALVQRAPTWWQPLADAWHAATHRGITA
jgi:Protein of unknown function (DUF2917)